MKKCRAMNQHVSPTIEKSLLSAEANSAGETHSKTVLQMIRYALNCSVVFLVKLALVVVLTAWLVPSVAYFLVHIVTFFLSYALHCRRTFGVEFSRSGLKNYFVAVILFKILDYAAFGVLVMAFELTAPLSVFLVSAVEAIIKFFAVRHALHRTKCLPTNPSKESTC